MPFPSGMCRSIKTTSGCRLTAMRAASAPVVASLTRARSSSRRSMARMPSRKADESSAMRMVILSMLFTPATAATPAPSSPPPALDVIVHSPPSSAARSRMEIRPTPAAASGDVPRPSSLIASSTLLLTVKRTRHACAPAWRTTLVSASAVIR